MRPALAAAARASAAGGQVIRSAGAPPRSRRVALDLVAFGDVAGCVLGGLAGGAAVVWRGDSDVAWFKLLQVSLLTALFCYLCLRHFGCYDTEKLAALPVQPLQIIAALGIAMVTMYGLGLPIGARVDHTRTWYGVWLTVSFCSVLANRLVAKSILARTARRGAFKTRLAIYGTGPLADRIAAALLVPGSQTVFAGAFDDRVAPGREASEGPGNLGGLDDLIALGRSGAVDQVIIALPQSADRRTADVARRLEQLPISLHIVTHIASDYVDPAAIHRVSSMGHIGLIDIKTKPLADWGRYLKSAEDYCVASVALLLALPVMLVVAVAIKWDSPGPVLFKQRRHGLNRRVIEVLKFRSMNVMENGITVAQASRGDARVTRVGAFLRSSSLDELPQLINVLRGEMSLIGPRPHALVHDDQYGEMLERYANRHQIKPGMTGWAQVNGFRGPTETPDKMQSRVDYDLAYIDRWSLWLDVKILVMTVFVGFRHKNAV
jgi:Undecaprenyl-phosphate glucose phosphotransferase